MHRIRKQVDHFQQQLSGLSLGQRVLTAVLVATMLAGVVWWIHHATTDQAVALFEQPLSAEQAADVKEALALRGIACEILGGQAYVSVEQAEAALLLLDEEYLLPSQTTDFVGDALAGGSLFETQQIRESRERNARVLKLEKVLRDLDGVRTAEVFINTADRQRLGEQVAPTASVSIVTNSSHDAREIADSAAALVAGSVGGLMKPSQVSVVIDGKRVAVVDLPAETDALASEERRFAQKIRESLPAIPQLAVAVQVVMDAPEVHMAARPPRMPESELESLVEALDDVSGDANLAGSEVRPNAARRIEDVLPDEQPRPSPAPTVASCALTVPLSWLIDQWQARHGTDQFPGLDELEAYEDQRIEELCQTISMAVGGLSPQMIAISVDNDVTLPGSMPPSVIPENEPAGISALIRDYGREVAMVALAAVSLLLAGTMLKKSAPVGAALMSGMGADMAGGGAERLNTGDELVQGGEIEPMVGEATQVLEQVQALVRNDPSQAAALVQRWLSAA